MLRVATKFTPEESAFAVAQAAGFGFAEFWLDANWLSQWPMIVRRAKKYDLGYAAHFPNRGDLSEATLLEAVSLCRELDCSAMVIHAPMHRRYGRQLLELDPSLRLGVENHRLDAADFERWAVENEWLTLDVEHLWKFTLQDGPVEIVLKTVGDFLDRFGEKLAHVHLPGYSPGQAEHRPMYCSRELVLPVFSLLADVQFEGLVVSEVNAEFQNTLKLRMDVLLWERWQELRQTKSPWPGRINPRVA